MTPRENPVPGNRSWRADVDRSIERLESEIIELRRYLHAHPELSGEEWESTCYLQNWLAKRGLVAQQVADGRGLLADVAADSAQPRFALRADTDALRIHDEKKVAYRSRVDNVMHACGHDAHAAILAGAALAIHELSQRGQQPWPIPLRAIFQPAEETCSGAKQMIAERAVEDVAAIMALHVDPTRDVGRIGSRHGVMTAQL